MLYVQKSQWTYQVKQRINLNEFLDRVYRVHLFKMAASYFPFKYNYYLDIQDCHLECKAG